MIPLSERSVGEDPVGDEDTGGVVPRIKPDIMGGVGGVAGLSG